MTKHRREKPYVCDSCGRGFCVSEVRKNLTHILEDECRLEFSRNNNLQDHMKNRKEVRRHMKNLIRINPGPRGRFERPLILTPPPFREVPRFQKIQKTTPRKLTELSLAAYCSDLCPKSYPNKNVLTNHNG